MEKRMCDSPGARHAFSFSQILHLEKKIKKSPFEFSYERHLRDNDHSKAQPLGSYECQLVIFVSFFLACFLKGKKKKEKT